MTKREARRIMNESIESAAARLANPAKVTLPEAIRLREDLQKATCAALAMEQRLRGVK